MSTQSLTAKYRPQTFAEVAGQNAIKTILSRAAAEDRVAPAYLFSGTRGVGKTTLARIFAKALNCEKAPTAEPCNECSRCKQALAGVFIDIVEIDGASHGRVDDARALKETVGYAPQEGRYKVIVIDEAHMLSIAAFNALLKTLEEPPPRVTFIMATTEVRKFPATIISRCQHFVFQMLSQQALAEHLKKILELEGISYEQGAIQILAKRGAGSVRDSISLLGQALALGQGKLEEQSVRSFLGLAGQDIFFSLMAGIMNGDVVAVGRVLRDILNQGLDIGFFLRELTACWRNLFLLRQAGNEAIELLSMSETEVEQWQEYAQGFSPAQIHSSWQMTVEGQRRVMSSLEPALALELLLLNLASLPDLLDLKRLSAGQIPSVPSPPPIPSSPPVSSPPPVSNPQGRAVQTQDQSSMRTAQASQNTAQEKKQEAVAPTQNLEQSAQAQIKHEPAQETNAQEEASETTVVTATEKEPLDERESLEDAETQQDKQQNSVPNLAGFRALVAKENSLQKSVFNLAIVRLEYQNNELLITCPSPFAGFQFEGENKRNFAALVSRYFGEKSSFRVVCDSSHASKPHYLLEEEAKKEPVVQTIFNTFDARLGQTIPYQK